ncbi:hypothetical protein BDQ17DRAFT_1438192 [Cyathus striatus]|nr:hypothetical protein BDQ17DRAFT_1438192 [Cyathus striatus]
MACFIPLIYIVATVICSVNAAAVASANTSSTIKTEKPFFAALYPSSGTTIVHEGPAATHVPGSTNTTEVSASVNFSHSCTWWGGTYGTFGSNFVATLQATCRTITGASTTTSLDLNKCIINASGYLRCQTNGGFLGSCQPTNSPTTGNAYLQATCGNGNGGYYRDSFDLNTCVGNSNGVLVC